MDGDRRDGTLDGKVTLVTGASSGIGRAVAVELAGRGATLVLAARSRDRLEALAVELGGAPLVVPTDVTDPVAVDALVARAVEAHGRIDVLVANAGVFTMGNVWEGDPDAFDRLLRTNVNGVVRLVHAALQHMVPAGTGDVLVTSSVSGHQAIPWEPVYSASKHAVQSFVHGLRHQLVGTGLRVGAVAPGVVLNDIWGVKTPEEIEAGVAAGTGIRSEDVADAVAWMLTRPRHVTIRDLVILPRDQEI